MDRVYNQIREIIADVLCIDIGDIQPNTRLMDDLAAESIDFLDLVFRIEQQFNVKIIRGAVETIARGNLAPEQFEINGIFSEAGIQKLASFMDELDPELFKPGLAIRHIPRFLTASTYTKLVLHERPELRFSTTGMEIENLTGSRAAALSVTL